MSTPVSPLSAMRHEDDETGMWRPRVGHIARGVSDQTKQLSQPKLD